MYLLTGSLRKNNIILYIFLQGNKGYFGKILNSFPE